MNAPSGDSKNLPNPPEDSTGILLLKDIGDTTWRMLIPSVGMTLLGVWLDATFSTKPWLMLVGAVVGFSFAILLVKRQLERVSNRKD